MHARWLGVIAEFGPAPAAMDVESLSFPGDLVVINVDSVGIDVEPRGRHSRTPRYTQHGGTTALFHTELTSRHLTGPADVLTVWVDPTFLAEVGREDPLLGGVPIYPADAVDDPQLLSIGCALLAEMRHDFPSGRLFGQSLSTALVARLLRRQQAAGGPARGESRGGLARADLAGALEYLHAHSADDVTLADLAAVAGLSPYHFARRFKRSTGLAPHQYLIRLRVERSKPMLAAGRFTVAHVAQSVGFSSQGLFASHFRRITGVSPGRYADVAR